MSFLFPEENVKVALELEAQAHWLAYPPIRIFYPDPNLPGADILYHDRDNSDYNLWDYRDIPASFQINPPKRLRTRFGIDEPRDIALFFSRGVLDGGGPSPPDGTIQPFPYPEIGCFFVVRDDPFQITEAQEDEFFENTSIFMMWICFGVKQHPSSQRGKLLEIATSNREPPVGTTFGLIRKPNGSR